MKLFWSSPSMGPNYFAPPPPKSTNPPLLLKDGHYLRRVQSRHRAQAGEVSRWLHHRSLLPMIDLPNWSLSSDPGCHLPLCVCPGITITTWYLTSQPTLINCNLPAHSPICFYRHYFLLCRKAADHPENLPTPCF